ncbi:hypothetical protein EW146_g2202 [Bondarzewia mesenterica]|uniref:Conserved oligomeric Golgi complex subunit 8 n=1 Tax=Bondarzewia mesenterica TaxID=1095465 RepID=A0A4S4M7K5_9AGAM|nr:hypothetical protein EW146_g2202 [Bondarzewia mesenterica]
MTDVEMSNGASDELSALVDVLRSGSSAPTPDLSSKQTGTYLSHLTTLPLPSLLEEPTNLSSTSSQLTNALTTLCTSSYPTFLSLHTATTGLSSSLSSFSSSLDQLLNEIPVLESVSKSFLTEIRDVQAERRRAALVLEHSTKLQDVLELPLLAEACVRNGAFQETLDLAAHAESLATRFPNVPVVQDVRAEVDHAVRTLLIQLLSMLREPAKLPALFKAVSFLRRMRVLSEDELALAFLTGRLENLDLALQAVEMGTDREKDKEAWVRFLKKYIDVWREGVHDIITQYTTIFLDRPSTAALAAAPSSPPSDTLRGLLPTFTSHLLDRLLTTLRDALPHILDPTSLTSLLTQLTYCATSFSRVGLDFRLLLPPLFEDAVRGGVTRELRKATEEWCGLLKPEVKPSASFAVAGAPLPQKNALAGPPHIPPQLLASYPPLANFTNTVLTTLNGLRLLAPVSLLPDILRALDNDLRDAIKAFSGYAKQFAGPAEAKDVVIATGKVLVNVFVPFVRRALVEGVYGIKMDEEQATVSQELNEEIRAWEGWLGATSSDEGVEVPK